MNSINIRLPLFLKNYTDGVDYSIWKFYIDSSLDINYEKFNELQERNSLTHGIKIALNNKSIHYLKQLVEETKISQSELIRRCLFWLSTLPTYPKNFRE